jgi:hypothetical protein
MKQQTGSRIKMGFVLMVLILVNLACGSVSSPAKTPTRAAEKKPTATQPVKPALPAVVPTDEPAATEAPIADKVTAEPVVESTLEPTVETVAEPTESWRISPMTGTTLVAFDQTPNLDPSWASIMDKQTRNLAIPKPYYFEIYSLPKGTKYQDLRDFYDGKITQNGMKKALDEIGDNGVAVATWVGTLAHNRKYLVQYIPGDSKYTPMMFIIYSNPK